MNKVAGWLVAFTLGVNLGAFCVCAGEPASQQSAKPRSRPGAVRNGQSDVRKASQEQTEEVAWAKDPKSAFQMAQSTGRPMLLVFSGKRCSWCRKLERETLADPKVIELVNDRFIPVHLDLDAHPELGEALEVEGLPTSVILTAEGDVLGSAPGFQAAGKYSRTLTAALAKQAAADHREIQQAGADIPLEKRSKRR